MSDYHNYKGKLMSAMWHVGCHNADSLGVAWAIVKCVDIYCTAIKEVNGKKEVVTISSIIHPNSSQKEFDFLWEDLLNQLDNDLWMVESDFNVYLKCDTLLQLSPILATKSGGAWFNFRYQDFPRGGMKLPLHLSDRNYGVCRGQRIYIDRWLSKFKTDNTTLGGQDNE